MEVVNFLGIKMELDWQKVVSFLRNGIGISGRGQFFKE